MKIAYLDCPTGISGDMLLGALVSAGAEPDFLRSELARLPLEGYQLEISLAMRGGFQATRVEVDLSPGGQRHRSLSDVIGLIEAGGLEEEVKLGAEAVFRRLAEAEAAAHGLPVDQIHFHEVGAVDALVDVVGAVAGLRRLGIEQLYCSPLPLGSGSVDCAHGRLPVPAPGTAELLRGVPVYGSDLSGELVTPTGAAIITTLARGFGPMPQMTLQAVGKGAGYRDLPVPNVARLFVGEENGRPSSERVTVLETNIDDLNPEAYEHLMDRLLEAGALDCYLTPAITKKSRPAVVVTVICSPDRQAELGDILFQETTTLGLRISELSRRCLDRRWQEVSTAYGQVRIKLGLLHGRVVTASPEYEDCRRLAQEKGVPFKAVYQAASNLAPPLEA